MSVDASKYAVGVVLGQFEREFEEREDFLEILKKSHSDLKLQKMIIQKTYPTYYWSKQLNGTQMEYSPWEKEALAVVSACITLHCYIHGRRTFVFTDQLISSKIYNADDLLGMHARWKMVLVNYELKFVRRAGQLHQDAYTMSRIRFSHAADPKGPPEEGLLTSSSFTAGITALDKFERSDFYGKYMEFFRTGEIPAGQSTNSRDRNVFRRVCPRYFVNEDNLWYRTKAGVRRCIVESEVEEILKAEHGRNGHYGRDLILAAIAKEYWWPKLYRDVHEWCKSCQQCQLYAPRSESKSKFKPYQHVYPFEIVFFDFMELPKTERGNTCLLTATDGLTGFVEHAVCRRQDSATAGKFLAAMVERYGGPKIAVVDGGRPFLSIFEIVAEYYGIKKVITIPYHSQSNGQDEATNRLFLDRIKKDGSNNVANLVWDLKAVHYAGSINRRNQQARGGFSAQELLYCYQDGLPLKTVDDYDWNKRLTMWKLVDIKSRMAVMETVREQAIEKRRMFQQQRADRWTKKVEHAVFVVGDVVKILDQKKKVSRVLKDKLTPNWLGPFQVVQVHGYDGYSVQPLGDLSKLIRTSVDFMRPYYRRTKFLFTSSQERGDVVGRVKKKQF